MLLATSKPPVINSWSPYYKKMSVYGQLEELKLRLQTAQPTIKQELTNMSLQSYEILCKFLDGLHDIQEFAKSMVQEYKNSIVELSVKEGKCQLRGLVVPNVFYIMTTTLSNCAPVVCPAFGFLEAQWPLSWRGQDKRRLVLL